MHSRLTLLCLMAVFGLMFASGCGGSVENELIVSDDQLDLEREKAFAETDEDEDDE